MRIREELVKAEVGDGFSVLVPTGESGGKSFVIELNETAARIYDGIAAGLDADKIAAQLVGEYAIAPEKAAQDVRKVIRQLADAGAVE